MKRTSKGSL